MRTRIDWKYLLCLELTDIGFDHTVLSEFDSRSVKESKEQMVLDMLQAHFQQRELLKARSKQRTDSTHVLGAIRAMKRMECVGGTMPHALNALGVVVPEWLLYHTWPDRMERYGSRVEAYRLPKSQSSQEAYVQQVGDDGMQLFDAHPQHLPMAAAINMIRAIDWSDGERPGKTRRSASVHLHTAVV